MNQNPYESPKVVPDFEHAAESMQSATRIRHPIQWVWLAFWSVLLIANLFPVGAGILLLVGLKDNQNIIPRWSECGLGVLSLGIGIFNVVTIGLRLWRMASGSPIPESDSASK